MLTMIRFLSKALKLNQLAPVRSDFDETLQGVCAGKYLQVYAEFC